MVKPLHVLFVISSANFGGGEIYLWNLLRGLVERGVACELLCLAAGPMVEEYSRLTNVTVFPYRRPGSLRELLEVREFVKRKKADIIHSHLHRAGQVVCLSCLGLRKRQVYTLHGGLEQFYYRDDDRFKHKAIRTADYFTYLMSNWYICVSQREAKTLNSRFAAERKLDFIRSAIHPSQFAFSGQDRSFPETLTVGYIGRDSREKGVDILRQLVCSETGKRLQWVIAGIEKERWGMNRANVEVMGQLRLEDRSKFYRKISLLILPSRSEGVPLSVLESYLWRRPVVVSNVGGLSEVVVSGKSGILVQYPEAAEFEKTLKRLTEESLKQMSQYIDENIAQLNPYDDFIDRHIEVYQSLRKEAGG